MLTQQAQHRDRRSGPSSPLQKALAQQLENSAQPKINLFLFFFKSELLAHRRIWKWCTETKEWTSGSRASRSQCHRIRFFYLRLLLTHSGSIPSHCRQTSLPPTRAVQLHKSENWQPAPVICVTIPVKNTYWPFVWSTKSVLQVIQTRNWPGLARAQPFMQKKMRTEKSCWINQKQQLASVNYPLISQLKCKDLKNKTPMKTPLLSLLV